MGATKRYAHYWWPIKAGRNPSCIAVVDCDATRLSAGIDDSTQKEQLTRWVFLHSKIRRGVVCPVPCTTGDTPEGFRRVLLQLLSLRQKTFLYATPASRVLALLGLWGEFAGFTLDCVVVEDPPVVLALRYKYWPGKVVICDMRNYGIEALSTEIEASERCQRYLDSVLLWMHTLRENGWGALRCTAGSQAVSALRTKYPVIRLHCHTDSGALHLERRALHGGRCECYRIGSVRDTTYHLDVRSLYPSLCLDLPIPVSIRDYSDDSRRSESIAYSAPQDCCAHVQIRTEVPMFPCQHGERTIYPIGIFDTTLCGQELLRAVGQGAVTRVYAAARYTCAPYLRPFFEEWLGMLERDGTQRGLWFRLWVKRIMTALIGKFAENGYQWIDHVPSMEQGPYAYWPESGPAGEKIQCRNVGNKTQKRVDNVESYWSIPAINAWVTAAGRCRLWDYLEAAGREGVWYVDTDSLFCNAHCYNRLLHGGFIRENAIGYLRLVGSSSRFVVHGIRHYEFGDTIACSGVPRGHIEPGETRAQYWWRQRAADAIREGREPDAERIRMTYPEPEPYHHGQVLPGGKVIPWRLGNE